MVRQLKHKPIDIDKIDDIIENDIEEASKLKQLEPALTTSGKMHHQQGHKGFAEGDKYDSYWEYAFALYNRECLGQVVTRNRIEKLHYIDDNGKNRSFYPDFIVAGKYYEVKGFLRPLDKCKMDQCWEVTFVFGDEIKPMIRWLNQHHPHWRDEYTQIL